MSTSRPRAVGAAVALLLLLTGCGAAAPTPDRGAGSSAQEHGGEHSPSPTTDAEHGAEHSPSPAAVAGAEHDDADVAFAVGMIEHHRGALDMAALAADRAVTPQVRDLAEQITAAQGPEIATMTAWLERWDVPVPAQGGHEGHGEGGMSDAEGMMTEADMAALEAATGARFDRLFLEGMIAHHEGAVRMAQRQLAEGTDPEATALATSIEAAQTQEIADMRALLGSLDG